MAATSRRDLRRELRLSWRDLHVGGIGIASQRRDEWRSLAARRHASESERVHAELIRRKTFWRALGTEPMGRVIDEVPPPTGGYQD